MPPWPASDKGVPLQHPRGLTAAQIDVMKRWGEAGGPLDVADSTKVRPKNEKDDAPKPRDDLDLRPAKAYAGDGTKVDDYRCFILDPKFTTTTYMTGYSFVPQHTSVVHHALIYEMGAKARAGADKLDGADGHPGWSCYGGTGDGRRRRRVRRPRRRLGPRSAPARLPGRHRLQVRPGRLPGPAGPLPLRRGRVPARPVDDEGADLDRAGDARSRSARCSVRWRSPA